MVNKLLIYSIMKLTQGDFLVISNIFNANLSDYEKRFEHIEKMLNEISKGRKMSNDCMTYDEMTKNIVKLSGDEYNRDFHIEYVRD